jgi:NTP pyrophosphatase (non-canonical NTP hydrolase)
MNPLDQRQVDEVARVGGTPRVAAESPTPIVPPEWRSWSVLTRDLNDLAAAVHKAVAQKGFETTWEKLPEKLLLVVTEIAEATEALRVHDRAGVREEIADTIIRLLDISGALGIDIAEEIARKLTINQLRPFKHGKAF